MPFFQGKAEFGELHPTVRKWCTAPTKIAECGDILISIRAPVGPTNVATGRCCIGRGLAAIRSRGGISQRYVLYHLRHTETELAENASGSTFGAISGTQLGQHPIAIAPLFEQQRIVAEIEKQFSRLDAALFAAESASARLRLYRRSITHSALTAARQSPHHKSTVSAVAELVQYGTSEKCFADSSGVAVLRMGNITSDGRLAVTELKYLPATSPEFPKLLLQPGDLLFNRTNSAELVGKCAVYNGSPTPCSFASYLIRVCLKPSCLPQFLALCINSDYGRAWIRGVASQQVGQANVNGTKLAAFEFPLPTLDIQRTIMDEVEEQISALDALESAIAFTKIRGARLRQAVLKSAFEGRLIPQDPDDEPASVLLERVRAGAHAPSRRVPRKQSREVHA